jgi:hypothetical protein
LEKGRQMVIRAEGNLLVAEGYENPEESPVVAKKWPFREIE